MEERDLKSNKMRTMPVHRLLVSMSVPLIIAMLIQAAYNVVDSIFVARISENALTAVSLAFPIQMLMIAVSTGLGVGMNAALSKSLGERDHKHASQIAMNGLFLSAIGFLIFLVVGIFGARTYMEHQNTTIAEIIDGGTVYLAICCICSFSIFFQVAFERLLQSTGRTMYTMFSQGIGAILNIVFDWILIFGKFGFPKMGIAGAAVATVFGQLVACILSLIFNLKYNKDIHFNFQKFRPSWPVIKVVLVVSIPSIIMQSIGSVMSIGMYQILMGFVSTAGAVFGVYFKLQSMVFMPVFGLCNGMIPIVAYNYGARNRERMVRCIKLASAYAVGMMALGTILMQVLPAQMLRLFDATEQMMGIGIPALRIVSLGFVMAGFAIVVSAVFQSLGNGVYSMITSFIRQLVVLLPAAYLLSLSGRIELVWWAFPIAEVACLIVSLIFLARINKKVLHPMKLET